MGHVPAQPRRGRPVPADRRSARRVLRQVRPGRRTCSSTAGASGGGWHRCSAATAGALGAGVQPAVHPARHPGAALRRGDRHGRRPRAAGARRDPDADAVVGRRRRVSAASDRPVAPARRRRRIRYERVNVADQRADPDSLLSWFERMIRTLRECPEVGVGTCTTLPVADPAVLVHRMDADQGSVLFLHNLGPRRRRRRRRPAARAAARRAGGAVRRPPLRPGGRRPHRHRRGGSGTAGCGSGAAPDRSRRGSAAEDPGLAAGVRGLGLVLGVLVGVVEHLGRRAAPGACRRSQASSPSSAAQVLDGAPRPSRRTGGEVDADQPCRRA